MHRRRIRLEPCVVFAKNGMASDFLERHPIQFDHNPEPGSRAASENKAAFKHPESPRASAERP